MMSSMSTMFGLSRNPDKYEARAAEYDKKGNPAKAQKNREKAAKLRQQQLNNASGNTSSSKGDTMFTNPLKSPERYDQKALKWDNKGNFTKAQYNRDKAARLRAEQGGGYAYNQFNTQTFNQVNPPNYVASASSTTTSLPQTVAPPIVETFTRTPIVEQTCRPEKIVEVQPVIHRDIERPQVHVIEQHSYEVAPPVAPSVITKPPLVQETVHQHVINEVQPVIHRTVNVPVVERVQEHITEHVVAPTTIVKEVQEVNTLHRPAVAAGGPIPPPPPPPPSSRHQ